jgi:hypothetical protein
MPQSEAVWRAATHARVDAMAMILIGVLLILAALGGIFVNPLLFLLGLSTIIVALVAD